jgi:UDP-N-acetylglucosamine--N-acetylmuramyl-(pentapeptide) pyrophosphoryl-undecaprenol N-acetylglucosamine transferase
MNQSPTSPASHDLLKEIAAPCLFVAGGGTGGHVLAGVAIAEEWKRILGPQARVVFVGARGGIEERLVTRVGLPLRLVDLGSLKRVSLGRRLKTLIQLPLSFIRSAQWLFQERPQAVIGVGGYASGPMVLMARLVGWIWGARVGIVEQNSVPGFTNRVLSFFAHKVCAAFPGMEAFFPTSKLSLTGNPIRLIFEELPPAQEKDGKLSVFIFGGSQGALGINKLVVEALPLIQANPRLCNRLRFIHQTGEKDHEWVLKGHREAGFADSRVEKFIYEMEAAYREASLVVCRAGSSTLSELARVGRASILIPFPFAADNHQEMNARVFSSAGASILLRQQDTKPEDLVRVLEQLLAVSSDSLRKMETLVKQFSQPKSAELVLKSVRPELFPDREHAGRA